jgi:SPP1 gp7 family putative phage head morphogenesis protein
MQRFNKACTLATFQGAGVTRVKWVTSHDGRVRATHKALDGKIFPVGELPPEVDDYNCRCGLVPVAWEDDE